ncbi:mycofactocin oligosaccharide methyltransferase MftM [soil metagenome]
MERAPTPSEPIAFQYMEIVLDPLAPNARGVWSAPGIGVRRRTGPHRPHRQSNTVCTPRFCIRRDDTFLVVEHDLAPEELSDELAVQLAEQLVDSGLVRGQSEFESVFTGVVRSTVEGATPAWLRFYRNSLARLEGGTTAFAPVHERAASLIRGGQVLDLGSCFGFFPLRLKLLGIDVTATDLSGPTMDLLQLASVSLQRPLRTLCCDAAEVPRPDRCVDTVTALHLLEHLPDATIDAVAREAVRLARHRVVIAVPFEDEPRACYGHIQRFDLPRLHLLGARLCDEYPGLSATVTEFHGGWLILDQP